MKPRIVRPRKRRATDHRALVLESVCTTPGGASRADIHRDCDGPDFTHKNVTTMVNQLRREGLIDWIDDVGVFVLTRDGFDYLTNGVFDRALPEYAPRPGARRRRKQT